MIDIWSLWIPRSPTCTSLRMRRRRSTLQRHLTLRVGSRCWLSMIIIDYLWLSMCVTNEIWVNNPFLDTWMAKLRLKTTPRLTGWRSSCSMWPTPPCRTSRSTPSPQRRWPGRPWRFGLFFFYTTIFLIFSTTFCFSTCSSTRPVSRRRPQARRFPSQ